MLVFLKWPQEYKKGMITYMYINTQYTIHQIMTVLKQIHPTHFSTFQTLVKKMVGSVIYLFPCRFLEQIMLCNTDCIVFTDEQSH